MRHPHWRKAVVIAATVNLVLLFTALSAQEGTGFWHIILGDPEWMMFILFSHLAPAAITYAAAAWLSRNNAMPAIVAPGALLTLGVLAYGRLIFGGPLDPDTARHMAVFLTAPTEFFLLAFVFALAWLAVRWTRRFTGRTNRAA